MAIIDGKYVAQLLREQIKQEIQGLVGGGHRPPCLAVVIVGDDPASHVYVKNKHLACKAVGIRSKAVALPQNATQKQVEAAVLQLNQDPEVDGYLVQLPLPGHLDTGAVLSKVDPKKDADGLTAENLGLFVSGKTRVAPCTPMGCLDLIRHTGITIEGKKAVVIGRSLTVGLPMHVLLTAANATTVLCHSRTNNLTEYTRQADIVVVAAGRPHLLGRGDFKAGAVVIDVGIHRQKDGLCGDVNFAEVKDQVGFITPVPGGVGPMTIAHLLKNTLALYNNSLGHIL